ncbi:hypothetical protein AAVH_33349, partial [Aphelenchoides avenae]
MAPSNSTCNVLVSQEDGATFDPRLLGICELAQTVIDDAVETRLKVLQKELKKEHTTEVNALKTAHAAEIHGMDNMRAELAIKHAKSERERKELDDAYQKELK